MYPQYTSHLHPTPQFLLAYKTAQPTSNPKPLHLTESSKKIMYCSDRLLYLHGSTGMAYQNGESVVFINGL